MDEERGSKTLHAIEVSSGFPSGGQLQDRKLYDSSGSPEVWIPILLMQRLRDLFMEPQTKPLLVSDRLSVPLSGTCVAFSKAALPEYASHSR